MRELVDHTADLQVRVAAPTLEGVFTEAGAALFEIIVDDLSQVRSRSSREFRIPAGPSHDMLHDWLAALHASFEIDRLLFRDFAVRFRGGRLEATAHGEPFDATHHRLAHEVKAVTRHGLTVQATAEGWEATFVVDV